MSFLLLTFVSGSAYTSASTRFSRTQRFSRLLMFAPVIINANVAPAMPVNAIVRVEGVRD